MISLFKHLTATLKEVGEIEIFIVSTAIICLLLNNYVPENWFIQLAASRWEMDSYKSGIVLSAGFSITNVVSLFAIPLIASAFAIRVARKKNYSPFPKTLKEFGLSWANQSKFLWVFIIAFFLLLPIILWASKKEDFQQMYPFFFYARYGAVELLTWWALYGLYYVGVEFFFRGFLLFGLYPKIGNLAIFVSTIPYVMVHFAKPPAEALGSAFAGIFLCYMALLSNSMWGGFFLHWLVGMTMDALSIYSSGGFISP
ncbi:MAG: CPBP family glutamic-type intramembrane protease [Spirochaetes bacterium]|nr:CPBP family glutamic-type intramembrane protease [Spirochaetota bacterium]